MCKNNFKNISFLVSRIFSKTSRFKRESYMTNAEEYLLSDVML